MPTKAFHGIIPKYGNAKSTHTNTFLFVTCSVSQIAWSHVLSYDELFGDELDKKLRIPRILKHHYKKRLSGQKEIVTRIIG